MRADKIPEKGTIELRIGPDAASCAILVNGEPLEDVREVDLFADAQAETPGSLAIFFYVRDEEGRLRVREGEALTGLQTLKVRGVFRGEYELGLIVGEGPRRNLEEKKEKKKEKKRKE